MIKKSESASGGRKKEGKGKGLEGRGGQGRLRGKESEGEGERERKTGQDNHCVSEKFPMQWLRRDLINTFREEDSLTRRGMSAQNLGPMFLSCALSTAEVVR